MSNFLDTYLENLFNYDERNVEKYVDVSGGVIVKLIDNIPHVLVIQRSEDDHWPLYWEIPRGKCDKNPNEKLKPCLKREVKEEVGLDVKPIRKIDSFSYIADEGKRKSTQYNFLCLLVDKNQDVILSKEHQDYKWIKSLGEIELLVLPELRDTISKVLSSKSKLVTYDDTDNDDKMIEEK